MVLDGALFDLNHVLLAFCHITNICASMAEHECSLFCFKKEQRNAPNMF